jgi:hypothetical protein
MCLNYYNQVHNFWNVTIIPELQHLMTNLSPPWQFSSEMIMGGNRDVNRDFDVQLSFATSLRPQRSAVPAQKLPGTSAAISRLPSFVRSRSSWRC